MKEKIKTGSKSSGVLKYDPRNKRPDSSIYRIKIALKGADPAIWRQLLVPANMLLSDLHYVIQTAMGWTNGHLHQFIKDKEYYGPPSEDDFDIIDYRKIRLDSFLVREKEKVMYEYDFGDGWMHEIILQKILPPDSEQILPVCLAGERACPPEDCGGIWGYMNLLEILKKPRSKKCKEMKEWVGDYFEPESFDIALVNELLQTEDYGSSSLFF